MAQTSKVTHVGPQSDMLLLRIQAHHVGHIQLSVKERFWTWLFSVAEAFSLSFTILLFMPCALLSKDDVLCLPVSVSSFGHYRKPSVGI